MSEFKNGDLVRLKKKCFNLPEWKRMRRIERREIAMIVKTNLAVNYDNPRAFTLEDGGECPATGVDKCDYLIPTALLESVEAKPLYCTSAWDNVRRSVLDVARYALTPTLHSYTPAQIAEARDIVYRLMMDMRLCQTVLVDLNRKCTAYDTKDLVNAGRPHVLAILLESDLAGQPSRYNEIRRAVAYCQPNDVWNDDVGRCASLCKLLGETMPVWLRGK